MPEKAAIISAADTGYFDLLLGLIQSVHDRRPNRDIDLCIIDLGMSAAQLEQLRPLVKRIVPGRWDFDFPAQSQTPRWFQAMSARPFLRDYFPGYDRYLWIDGDAWLADWRPVELLLGDATSDAALVPEIHAAYPYLYGLGNLRAFNFQRVTESFGEDGARILHDKAIINAGVFALARNAALWDHYRELVQFGYRRSVNKWTEQFAMNLCLYTKQIAFRVLPAWCNWICCYAAPRYDPQRRCLCEPIAPFEKISLVHITGINQPGLKLRDMTGRPVDIPIDYLNFKRAVSG